jgi:hypothetical protein
MGLRRSALLSALLTSLKYFFSVLLLELGA